MRIVPLLALSLVSLLCAEASDPVTLTIDSAAGRLEIKRGPQRIGLYSFGSNQFKPYLKELHTVGGENVLLDAPPDHLHHHGLMYAVRINGINFWEEVEPAGKQKHIALTAQATQSDAVSSGATFSELVHWLNPTNAVEPLLTEKRTLTITVTESQDEVAVRWQSHFKVGSSPVTLTGTAYNGLGMRFPAAWNGTAEHTNSEGLPYTAEHKWDVTAARWAAVSHGSGTFHSTVALFGNPANAGNTRFFSMNQPFTYLSVTQALDKVPLTYRAGQEFTLDYLVLAYSGQKTPSLMEDRYARWMNPNMRKEQ